MQIFQGCVLRTNIYITNENLNQLTFIGEMYHDTQAINIVPDTANEPCVLLIWPLTILHIIDEDSPFYE